MSRRSGPRVLVIEFDPDYRAVIARCVELAAAEPDTVSTVAQGLRRLENGGYSVVVWGVSLKETRRAEGAAQLRLLGGCPLIILDETYEAARESFEAGADQLLPKPFVPGALVGAVTAGLRGPGPSSLVPLASRIEVSGVTFDSSERSVSSNGAKISLTGREWELIAFLLANPNQYFPSEELARRAWGDQRKAPEQVRSYVGRLRRKLDGIELPGELTSKQGRGYCLKVDGPR